MAVFFMASGYFFSDKNTLDLKSVAKYTWGKILTFYVPYVLFNGAIFLLTNLFIKIGLVTNQEAFLQIGGEGAAWGLVYPYDRSTLKICMKALLRFHFEPQLAGATWFLRGIFFVSVGHCVLMWLLRKVKHDGLRKLIFATVIVLCCVGAEAVNAGVKIVPSRYKILPAAYIAFLLGQFVRKKEHLFKYDFYSALISAALLYALKSVGGVSLNIGAISNLPYYVMCSLLGWILLRSVAELLSGKCECILALCGKHTMAVMFWHFIAFKLVTLAVILLRGDNLLLLASFPQLDGSESGLWVAYTIVGVGVPVLIGIGYEKAKKRIIKQTARSK